MLKINFDGFVSATSAAHGFVICDHLGTLPWAADKLKCSELDAELSAAWARLDTAIRIFGADQVNLAQG